VVKRASSDNAFMVEKTPTNHSKALSIANNERIYKHLITATYGVIFLGTPHQGSGHANIATVFANIVKFAYPRTNTRIIESLRPSSNVLQDLTDDFRNLHTQFNIASFYELRPKASFGLVSSHWE
jgi:hypothetical protein